MVWMVVIVWSLRERMGVLLLLRLLLLLLVILHVRRQSGRGIITPIANGALEWLTVVVRLHVDLEVITREGRKEKGKEKYRK